MPKAIRLFLHDDIKLNVSTNVPGTQIDTRVMRAQGANINVIDLSKRLDIESIHLQLNVKQGIKPYVSESNIVSELPKAKKENFSLSRVQEHVTRFFKRNK